MTGFFKLTASIVILLVAALAMAVVFDAIPGAWFSEAVKKILLGTVIVGLTVAGVAYIMRLGK